MEIDRFEVFGEQLGRIERIAPGFFPTAFEREHVFRYKWASRWITGKRVLDIACGTGYGAEILRWKRPALVLSLDLSEAALRFGLEQYGINPLTADAHSLPLVNECIDVVVSLETIEHLTDPSRFLRELRRVLRPGGLLALSTPNRLRSTETNPYHINELRLEELVGLLGSVGFNIRRVWGQHWQVQWPLQYVWGLRRIAWDLERSPSVIRFPWLAASPEVWCILAVRVS